MVRIFTGHPDKRWRPFRRMPAGPFHFVATKRFAWRRGEMKRPCRERQRTERPSSFRLPRKGSPKVILVPNFVIKHLAFKKALIHQGPFYLCKRHRSFSYQFPTFSKCLYRLISAAWLILLWSCTNGRLKGWLTFRPDIVYWLLSVTKRSLKWFSNRNISSRNLTRIVSFSSFLVSIEYTWRSPSIAARCFRAPPGIEVPWQHRNYWATKIADQLQTGLEFLRNCESLIERYKDLWKLLSKCLRICRQPSEARKIC